MSRSGRPKNPHPLGKCSERIDIPVPEDFKRFVASIATLKGISLTQYARRAVEERAIVDAYRMGVNLPPRDGDDDGINIPRAPGGSPT